MKRFGLSSKERIKSKKEIQLLYKSGETINSNSLRIKAIFCFDNSRVSGFTKVMFAVSRKAGNSVWRNRIKRLLREAYRLNKDIINIVPDNSTLLLAFSLNRINQTRLPKPVLSDLQSDVVEILNKIKEEVSDK